VQAIIALANDEAKQNDLKKNIGELGIVNADERIVDEVIKSLQAL
jgi:hypothetical protein